MKTEQNPSLPLAAPEYSMENEQQMQIVLEWHLQDLRADIVDLQNQTNSAASMALLRHKFLLMGSK